ncbi:RNA polymerase sigma-70 factor [Pseudoflavitalea sp. G-6-1-2]|uniref:RNA polymerase sigma factor n=1 Tax=Pseudoflavitalea sp. G-6-1-2 TaxID=2728841 RepID=UPI00146B4B4F|nr:RNA polymerase sigma-70 factor [Pseudoflavitalea sp. G-6-1-2]NML24081.1 RNA polymerase sigma-70 factor [Pseudoflavitalea sp. G-6-1-2]
MNFSDQDALELLQQDPVKGFQILFDKYWEMLYAIAVTKLPSREEARDTVQEVFLSLWTSRESIRSETSLFPWLSTCLKNRIYNHYARTKTRQQFIRDMEGRFTGAANDVAEKLASGELKKLIEEAISQLPPKMQLVFRMNKEQQLSPAEIAKNLHVSVQTVKNQLYRANDQVKEYIAARIEPSILIIILLTMLEKK